MIKVHSLRRKQILLIAIVACVIAIWLSPVTQTVTQIVKAPKLSQLPKTPKLTLADLIVAARSKNEAQNGTALNSDWGVPKSGDFDSTRDNGTRLHGAYDLARSTEAATLNQPVYAPLSGIARYASDTRCGHGLRLTLDQVPLDLVMCHLAARPRTGRVKAGDTIARVGKTGSANYPNGAHLHVSGRSRTNELLRLNKAFLEQIVVLKSSNHNA